MGFVGRRGLDAHFGPEVTPLAAENLPAASPAPMRLSCADVIARMHEAGLERLAAADPAMPATRLAVPVAFDPQIGYWTGELDWSTLARALTALFATLTDDEPILLVWADGAGRLAPAREATALLPELLAALDVRAEPVRIVLLETRAALVVAPAGEVAIVAAEDRQRERIGAAIAPHLV